MNETHEPGQCHICRENTNVRWKNIYHMGSEGLTVCMPCEMKIVEFVRELRRDHSAKRKFKYIKETP